MLFGKRMTPMIHASDMLFVKRMTPMIHASDMLFGTRMTPMIHASDMLFGKRMTTMIHASDMLFGKRMTPKIHASDMLFGKRMTPMIHASDKTKYMLFSYNKNVNFPIIKIGNNKINETSVPKYSVIHLDKKLNFINLFANSIGLLSKLFLKRYILCLFIPTYHMVWKNGIEHVKIIPLKSSFSRKKSFVQYII